MNQEKIGKFIARLRRDKGLTQEELASRIGVSNKSISRWENGVCMPDLSLFEPLSRELSVSINDLMNGQIVDKNEYQNSFEKNILTSLSSVNNKNKCYFRISLVLLIIIVIFLLGIILPSTISIKLKYDEDKMFVSNHSEYGLRFINKNSCTVYAGDIDYVIKDVKIDGHNMQVIFVTASCTIKDIYKFNISESESYRMQNFDIFDDSWQNKYQVYYTRYNLQAIEKTNSNEELLRIIDKSYLLSVRN